MYLLKIKDSKCVNLITNHHNHLRHWNCLSTPLYDDCFPVDNYEDALENPLYADYKWFCTSRISHFFRWFPLPTLKALSQYDTLSLLIYDSKNHQTLAGRTQTIIIGDFNHEQPIAEVPLAKFVRILESSDLALEDVVHNVATQYEQALHMQRSNMPA